MVRVRVTLMRDGTESSLDPKILACSVPAAGSLLDLRASIEAQLGQHETLTSLLYKGCEIASDSLIQDLSIKKRLGCLLQAKYKPSATVHVCLPSGQILQSTARADNSVEHLKEELGFALGAEFMQLHRLVLERTWALNDDTVLPGSKIHLERQLDITLNRLTGEAVQVHAWPSETVEDLMHRLKDQGLRSANQQLILDNRRLASTAPVCRSGLQQGSVVQLVPRRTKLIQVEVVARGLGGCNVQSLELEPDTSIKHIMELMRDKTEISVSKQRMMFDGHRLLPFQTLEELGVEDADQLNILEEQRAGQHTYADNSNAGAMEEHELTTRGAVWRRCGYGLHIEGQCTSPDCQAFGMLVIDCKGMHAFNLIRDTASCPMCHNGIKPVICAFRGCAWLYEGRKLGPDGTITHCSSDWEEASADDYDRFDDDGGVTAVWESLVICARDAEVTEDMPCPVCWELVEDGDDDYLPECMTVRHGMHTGCVEAWQRFTKGAGCPICRIKMAGWESD